ncbi:MAG: hypothetical protein FWH22_02225, partial [Fibromonadales bacterium]|nr:hypothetical protein [Fibromonadales bacterium]
VAWASLIGLPGLACFWSKDLILERVYGFGPVFFYAALFTALLTAIYMTRLMVLVFLGKFRGNSDVAEHAHESPFVMQLPMWILVIGCIFAGYTQSEHSAMFFAVSGSVAALIGLVFAAIYFRKKIPKYSGHNELTGFAKVWTFAFDKMNFAFVILPARIAMFALDLVHRFLRMTMILIGAIPDICAEGLRFMQAGKLRAQLALSAIGSVILIYGLVFFIR